MERIKTNSKRREIVLKLDENQPCVVLVRRDSYEVLTHQSQPSQNFWYDLGYFLSQYRTRPKRNYITYHSYDESQIQVINDLDL